MTVITDDENIFDQELGKREPELVSMNMKELEIVFKRKFILAVSTTILDLALWNYGGMF